MRPKSIPQDQNLLFSSRSSVLLKPDHEFLKLAKSIPWEQLEAEFSPLFLEGPSRPPSNEFTTIVIQADRVWWENIPDLKPPLECSGVEGS